MNNLISLENLLNRLSIKKQIINQQEHCNYVDEIRESAIALHTDKEPNVYKTERKEIQPIIIEPEKVETWKKNNLKFHSLSITEDEHVVNLYNK